jgi:hypothetical protein
MFKTLRVVLEFIYPIILGILKTLQIFNSTPKNVRHFRKIPMIQKKKKTIRKFGKKLKFS